MTPVELIAAFESLAEAPDGVACLRELTLQLAVRGRLVEQRPGDGAASDLVQRVLAEAKGRKIRVEIVHESRKPFDVPASWGWVYLGDAMDLFNGRAFKPADWRSEGLRIVRIQNLNDPDAAYNHCDPAIDRRFCIDSGCLLLSWSGTPGTSFGAFVWQGGLAALNQHIFRCEPRADAFAIHFLRLAINSRLNEMIARAHGGVGLRHITKGKLEGLWLPVPPLAEQHRIVARVEELMGLLDRLEAARAKRETTRAAARDSVLASLRKANSPAEVDAAWTRFAQRMDDLVCDPADIAPLRQTVLQLAVRGRLARQSAGDEPADELLERIAKEKARLTRKEREPDSNGVVSRSEASVPFAIPGGWAWSRLGSILIECRNGTSASPNDSGVGYPVLRISACTSRQDASVDLTDCKFAELPETLALPYFVQPGDLLACRYNGNLRYVGRVALVPEGRHQPTLYPDKLIRLRALEVEHGYLRIAINAGPTRKQIESVAATTAGNIGINGKQMQALLVPIPPLAEQRRIITRVNALMRLLDHLEQRLATLTRTHGAFAAAAANNGMLS